MLVDLTSERLAEGNVDFYYTLGAQWGCRDWPGKRASVADETRERGDEAVDVPGWGLSRLPVFDTSGFGTRLCDGVVLAAAKAFRRGLGI